MHCGDNYGYTVSSLVYLLITHGTSQCGMDLHSENMETSLGHVDFHQLMWY